MSTATVSRSDDKVSVRAGRTRRKLNSIEGFDVFVFIFLTLFGILIFWPFYSAVLSSFVNPRDFARNPAMLIPTSVTFDNYRAIFVHNLIFLAYRNTIIITFFGTAYSLFLTVTMAYGFAQPSFPGKKLFFSLVLFTMFFGGGLIPFYLLVRTLGLMGHLPGLIVMSGLSIFFMVIMKGSFEQIPDSLRESAKIDGANDILIFWKIMLPLQKPMLATFTLFFAVGRWNEWFLPLLMLNDARLWPLQVILRSIVNSIAILDTAAISALEIEIFPTGIRMAAVVVTMLPIMLFYPFLQKYFAKGMMVGAIKM